MMKRIYNSTKSAKSHPRDFAHSLLQKLGYQEACQACLENQWHGVFKELAHEKRTRS